MNDSIGGGNFNTTETGGVQSERKPEGIVPVFIKQLLQSPEGNFHMWGMSFGMVSCVALVRAIDASATKVTYKLEDHTGKIDAHYWLEEGDAAKCPNIMINAYAQIYGTVRQSGGTKTVMIFKITTILGINKLTTHMLEVLNSRYMSERIFKKGASNFSDFGGGIETGIEERPFAGLNDNQQAVLRAIRNYGSANNENAVGISMDELKVRFKHIPEAELRTIAEFLTDEGHAYTSVDSDHFLCTEAA